MRTRTKTILLMVVTVGLFAFWMQRTPAATNAQPDQRIDAKQGETMKDQTKDKRLSMDNTSEDFRREIVSAITEKLVKDLRFIAYVVLGAFLGILLVNSLVKSRLDDAKAELKEAIEKVQTETKDQIARRLSAPEVDGLMREAAAEAAAKEGQKILRETVAGSVNALKTNIAELRSELYPPFEVVQTSANGLVAMITLKIKQIKAYQAFHARFEATGPGQIVDIMNLGTSAKFNVSARTFEQTFANLESKQILQLQILVSGPTRLTVQSDQIEKEILLEIDGSGKSRD